MLLAHLGHQAASSVNRARSSWTHPAGLFWGSQSEEGLLGISAALSYSSRSFCPKGSFDVQNRLWCQYESSIVRLGTDNALGRLFIYKSTQCLLLPYSLQMQIEWPSSCKPNRLAQADKNHPESSLYLPNTESPHTHTSRKRQMPSRCCLGLA